MEKKEGKGKEAVLWPYSLLSCEPFDRYNTADENVNKSKAND